MFFTCELKYLRKLKLALRSRYRCEKIIEALPNQLEPRIDNCPELAAMKLAEENLEAQKRIDAENRKKRLRRATIVGTIIALVVSVALAFVLSSLPFLVVAVGGTVVLALIIRVISKAVIKKSRAKNADEILVCEEELLLATEAFENAKIRIEAELQEEIEGYENLLKQIDEIIKKNTVVHDADKNYNTVCQIIWCFEHKYARSVIAAKQWIARANHSKYVRSRLDEIKLAPQDDAEIDVNATEGNDYSEEIPQSNVAEA